MKITLIYPPAGDVRAPQLALPSLAAYLRPHHQVTIRDLNLEAILAFLKPEAIQATITKLKQHTNLVPHVQHLLKLAAVLPDIASHAPDLLRNPDYFFDPHEFNTARDSIQTVLKLTAASLQRDVNWSITPLEYEIKDADPACLDSILETTSNDGGNVFAELWRTNLLADLKDNSPDIIGITITNRQQWWPSLYLARLLKQEGYFVILGGALISKFVKTLTQCVSFFEAFCHVVINYEGEHAFLGLTNALENKKSLADVPNLLYLKDEKIYQNPTVVEDVSKLPTPDFTSGKLNDYLIPKLVLPILTGKGCYFNRCKFCDIPYINHISRKPYRVRPVETTIQDLKKIHAQTGCTHFLITDEALAPKLLKELALALTKENLLSFSFTGYARFEAGFNQELCQLLAQVGFKKIYFGLESASQQTIDHMDKGVQIENIIPVLERCRDANINVHIFSIIGFPQENETEALKTFEFFKKNYELINYPGNSFDIHPFGLQLHTKYFDEANQMGIAFDPSLLQRPFSLGLDNKEWTNTQGLNAQEINTLINEHFYPELKEIYQRWHNTPLHLWPGFEEYATLYSDWYQTRPFTAITSITHLNSKQFFTLRWHPIHHFDYQGEQAQLTFIQGVFTLPSVLVHIFSAQGVWCLWSLTAACFGEQGVTEVNQQYINQLIHSLAGLGIIQLNQVEGEWQKLFHA